MVVSQGFLENSEWTNSVTVGPKGLNNRKNTVSTQGMSPGQGNRTGSPVQIHGQILKHCKSPQETEATPTRLTSEQKASFYPKMKRPARMQSDINVNMRDITPPHQKSPNNRLGSEESMKRHQQTPEDDNVTNITGKIFRPRRIKHS